MCCMVGAENAGQAVLPGQNTHVLHTYRHTHTTVSYVPQDSSLTAGKCPALATLTQTHLSGTYG